MVHFGYDYSKSVENERMRDEMSGGEKKVPRLALSIAHRATKLVHFTWTTENYALDYLVTSFST